MSSVTRRFPIGAEPQPTGGVHFRVWAPAPKTVSLVLEREGRQQDVELEGVPVPAGARVDVCLGAANRDPAVYENPDVYDIRRERDRSHLGFGMGPHRCLGLEVAKQEMVVAIENLLDRFPQLALDTRAPAPQLLGGLEQRGMSAVPVTLV